MTLLFGGLTIKHEFLIHGALHGLGYRNQILPTPTVASFQLGKEYGNNGQCNPTYFTVGNLVKHLQHLRDVEKVPAEEIKRNYVYLTAGACGPCRFGMYEAEYRLALRNAGFDGFRVILFQQSGGLNQVEAEAGLEMNMNFFTGLLSAFNLGDLVNEICNQIRPYEVEDGATQAALDWSLHYLHDVLRRKRCYELGTRLRRLLEGAPKLAEIVEGIGKLMAQLRATDLTDALRVVGERFNEIEIDRLRVKPLTKITGEFWAQTTEGDGNFNMFRFLEREGSEVLVEPVATWITYMLHQARQSLDDRRGLDDAAQLRQRPGLRPRLRGAWEYRRDAALLSLAGRLFQREYDRLRRALGGTGHELVCQRQMQRLGHPFYNSRASGGEGHLEVAKNIYYSNKDLAHFVLSLKPFGCMPSTQSDGAQSAVVSLYKDMLFLPIETSGEGEINAQSRVQMALGEAKAKAKAEFARVREEIPFTLDEVRAYVNRHDELRRPLSRVPRHPGVIGTAANFLKHVAERMAA
ncbi:MAG: activator of (R)-2-hydroxyglutaryl-CoA dehydratase [Candidatus Tectomicrobia bacterium]|nr:activator of (R)-2-hydroxyglutaryl-CoA dehydratase [Candidatus Tectomicrobia bacterium]